MIEAAALPIWMILSAAFGFFAGEAEGDYRRHRKTLEKTNADLRDQLQQSRIAAEPIHSALKQQNDAINEILRQLDTVTKWLEKRLA